MRYRPLGRTGWEVSELGLGTYPLGGALVTSGSYWAGPSTYGAVAREEAIATIHAGLAAGLNFVDTAPNYAEAEVFIGDALRTRPAALWDVACFAGTKCGARRFRRTSRPSRAARCHSPSCIGSPPSSGSWDSPGHRPWRTGSLAGTGERCQRLMNRLEPLGPRGVVVPQPPAGD